MVVWEKKKRSIVETNHNYSKNIVLLRILLKKYLEDYYFPLFAFFLCLEAILQPWELMMLINDYKNPMKKKALKIHIDCDWDVL